jgi:hypothetical protein
VTLVSDNGNASPTEDRRAALHRERVEAIEGLRGQITALEEREPELKKAIPELEKTRRTTLAALEKTQRTTISELEKAHRAKLAEQLPEDLENTRDELAEELARTRSELAEQLTRTRTELDDELARLRTELAAIGPTLIDTRCTLGMKMSDIALDEDDGHEEAVEYLKPLLVELKSTHSRDRSAAKRGASEAEAKLKELHAEHHESPDDTLPLVEQRFQPLIDAEVIGVSIEQANVRVARHQLALVDPDDSDQHLARELELEAAQDELHAARAKVEALQEEKRAAVYHHSHPTAEKSKRLGEKFAKRFARHH